MLLGFFRVDIFTIQHTMREKMAMMSFLVGFQQNLRMLSHKYSLEETFSRVI